MPKTEETPRLLLLDGHSLAYRAFYALKDANLMTTDGQHTEAVYGFLSMLTNIMRDEAPTHLVVCFDRSEPTFRHEAFAAYKANRSETPEDFRGQMQLIYELLDVMKVPHLSLAGYEADDLIATLATRASGEGMDVLIVTGDRDALQLVDPKVTVLMTRRGISDMTRFTPEAVLEKYGLTPNQYPDFAALRGDPSDNLPSIPSVGEKTATKWISEFGSLDELVRRADEVKGKVGDKLREHLGQVIHNRMLTELRRDVALDAEPAALVMGQWDREELNKILDSLQIRGELRERLFKVLGTAEPEVEGGFEAEIVTLQPGGLAAWLGTLAAGRTALAFAGSWGSGTGRIDAMAFAVAGGTAAYLDLTQLTADDEADLAAWLADESIEKAVHDSKGLLLGLWAQGYDLRGLTCDTALAAYLAMPGQRSFPLDDLVLRYLHRTLENTAENQRPDQPVRRRRRRGRPRPRDEGGGRPRPGRGAGEPPVRARRHPPGDRRRAPAGPGAGRGRAGRHRRRRRLLRRPGGRVRRRGEVRRRRRPRGRGGAVQPGLAQAAPGDLLRAAQPAEDQEDQDRLQHRRRPARLARHPDRPRAPHDHAPPPRPAEAAHDGRGPDQGDRRRRPHPHHVQPDHRRDRPPVVGEAQPAEHPDPDRRGPPHPQGLRRRPRLRDPADGRLQPDRAAHHGPPERRPLARRGLRVGPRLPRRHRRQGLRHHTRDGHGRDARQDQGDELRPGLRPERLRPVGPAQHPGRRGPDA